MSLLRVLPRSALRQVPTISVRPFSATACHKGEGATGSIRYGGERSADTWSKREKAAEDMYIKGREKAIMELLKEKIAKQEEGLAKDRAILSAMEDQYGHMAEERAM